MKPLHHANLSRKKFGGKSEDYMDIHEFLDSSFVIMGDVRHRAMLHHTFGLQLVERVFGAIRVNSDGREYSTRAVAEEHIVQDLGFIPTPEMYLRNINPFPTWIAGNKKFEKKAGFELKFEETVNETN